MDILYLLIPMSVALVLLIGAVFWYALGSGQFDDLDGPGIGIIADDDSAKDPATTAETNSPRGALPLRPTDRVQGGSS